MSTNDFKVEVYDQDFMRSRAESIVYIYIAIQNPVGSAICYNEDVGRVSGF